MLIGPMAYRRLTLWRISARGSSSSQEQEEELQLLSG
jgi:hypothetical protein